MGNERYEFGHHYILLDNKLDQHIHAFNNPHKVTKAQVGLGNVDDVSTEEIYETVETYVDEGFGNHLDLKQNQLTGEYTVSLISKTGEVLGNPIIINTDNEYAITDIYLDVEKENLVFERYNADPTICNISPIFDELRNLDVKIKDENIRAKEAEDELSNKISAEETRASDAEEELQRNINAETACREEDVNNAREEFKEADEEIRSELEIERSKINEEISRAKDAESELSQRLDIVEGEGEGSIKKAVADEATIARAAEEALDAKFSNYVDKTSDETIYGVKTFHDNIKFSAGNELTFYGQTNTALTLGNYADEYGSYISYHGPNELKISTNMADLKLDSGEDVYINSWSSTDPYTPDCKTVIDGTTIPRNATLLTSADAATNLQNGSGKDSLIQKGDTQEFIVNNPNATNNGETVSVESDGLKSTAVFNGSSRATGSRAFAANSKTQAIGDRSATFGNQTVAEGVNSFAVGNQTTAKNSEDFASGILTLASGGFSFATGNSTKATGNGAFAEGQETTASGWLAHAQGYSTTASNAGSYAGGAFTTTGADYQYVIGLYNIGKADTLFEIGNGNAAERKNIFEVYADGHAEVKTQGTTNNSVVLKEYVDTETARAKEAEADLDTAISVENARATAEENDLQSQIDAITASSDVVDIVKTKAELNEYDTSKLTKDDIVKVLSDESKFGATTYYRFINTESETWKDIGSVGPYYTKSETDNLLTNKADLGTDGKILDEQLPDWVNDVIGFNGFATAQTNLDINKKYFDRRPGDTYHKFIEYRNDMWTVYSEPASGKLYSYETGTTRDRNLYVKKTSSDDIEEISQGVQLTEKTRTSGQGEASKAYPASYGAQNYNDIVQLQSDLADEISTRERIDEEITDKIYDVVGELNIEKGSKTGAVQQKQDGTTGKFDFNNRNPNATAIDPKLTGQIDYGSIGEYSAVFGGKAQASGKRSFAQGTTTVAKGNYSHAEGDNSVALGNDSHAEGYQTTTNGMAAHSEGFNTLANAHSSHSEGFETKTFGDSSHAEGAYSQTLKQYVVAKSDTTSPDVEQPTFDLMATNLSDNCGYAAHAEGSSKALGYLAHSQGSSNAYGHYSFASGIGCQTGSLSLISETDTERVYTSNEVGRGAHAFGVGAYAQYNGQTAVGMFNDNKDTTLFEVGNGASHGHRSNALEVHSDGLVVIPNGAKGIKIGNTILTEEKLNKLIALLDTMEAE